ncbi:hypothetical protein [Pseudomonas sp. WC2401]|uniref:Uncharacterized protein n=1 Tax=Pseudomonas sp. WC2401 TaxID=3234143 RepID=A0AB39WV76_9PSED
MGFYRFMASKYMDDTLKGKLRFTSLSYYRLMEKVWDDGWIGDCQEGQAFTTIDKLDLPPGVDVDGARKKLEDARMIKGSGFHLTISNLINVSEENGFVLCFAKGELNDLKKEMLRDGYDSCASFRDLDLIARKIYESGVDGEGRRLSDIFDRPIVKDVSYGANQFELREVEGFVRGSALVKREKYIEQNECRIFFSPKVDLDIDFVNVSVDLSGGYVVEEFRLAPIPASISKRLDDIEDPLVLLGNIRNKIYSLGGEEGLALYKQSQGRAALLAYWQLRKDHRWHRLDTFFCMSNHNGGSMAQFTRLLDQYFELVTGMDYWGVANWAHSLRSN